MFLPILGNFDRAAGFAGIKVKTRSKGRSVASIPRTKGLSYPGPQPILSEPPNPTNEIQTLLQPALQNPPILTPPLSLPNFVQMAEAAMTPKPQPPKPPPAKLPDVQPEAKPTESILPPIKVEPPTVTEAPRLVFPASALPTPEPKPPEPFAKSEETPKPEPPASEVEKPKEPPPLPGGGPDKQDILALTPIPAPVEQTIKVPVGEARGRFAISPDPNLGTSETEPGSKREAPEAVPGLKNSEETIAMTPPVVEVNIGPVKNKDSSKDSAGGSGAKRDAGAGTTGNGADSGKGAGPAAGKKPFSGITIVGGSYDPGTAPNPSPVVQARRPLQTAYGLTVISTEDSGGGLPFFGVFSQEQIYTVYLDMRLTELDSAPSWTLEFAVFRNPADPASESSNPSGNSEGLVLPFPSVKEQPVLPADLLRRHLRSMVIVYAVINTEGKMEQLSVKQSPDDQLDEPLLSALRKWIFRPARLNGEPVAVKALLGIPLWLPEQNEK